MRGDILRNRIEARVTCDDAAFRKAALQLAASERAMASSQSAQTRDRP